MASINKILLIGNLGADPEIRYTPSGDAICNLRLATTEQWKDKSSGDMREATEWHRVVLYRRMAEIAQKYLRKGSSAYIEGRIRTRKWQDKEGKERYTTEIEATDMKMLGGIYFDSAPETKNEESERTTAEPRNKFDRKPAPFDPADIPF